MKDILDQRPVEESTALASVEFKDESGLAITPSTLKWTLTDAEGVVINNRKDVDVASPANPTEILLSGDDLALIDEEDSGYRILTFVGTYNSAYGSDLPLKSQTGFYLEKLVAYTP